MCQHYLGRSTQYAAFRYVAAVAYWCQDASRYQSSLLTLSHFPHIAKLSPCISMNENSILQRRPENVSSVSFVTQSHFKCITQFQLFMGFLGSIHHRSNKTDLNSTSNFFSSSPHLVRTKRLLFSQWAGLPQLWHIILSDTFIINYIQAARWHPTLAWGKQWVVRELWGESCVAWLHREQYWLTLMFLLNQSPSPIGHFLHYISSGGRRMVEMGGCVQGAYLLHCRDSISRFSVVSITTRIA